MADDEEPHTGLGDRDSRERVLMIVLAVVGVVITLVLSTLPIVAGVPHSPLFAGIVGALNLAGYASIVLVAAQPPLRSGLVRRIARTVVCISIIAAIWAVTGMEAGGPSFLLAMSGLMAAVILGVERIIRSSR